MKVPLTDMRGNTVEILDSRDLTAEEWALVKKNPNGALSLRDLPDNVRKPE